MFKSRMQKDVNSQYRTMIGRDRLTLEKRQKNTKNANTRNDDPDPQLAATADSNGETDVFAIAQGSPARDRFTCSGADQRDLPRPQGTGCDAGAYEYAVPAPPVEPPPPPTPTPTPPVPTATPTPAPGTHLSVASEPVSGRGLDAR